MLARCTRLLRSILEPDRGLGEACGLGERHGTGDEPWSLARCGAVSKVQVRFELAMRLIDALKLVEIRKDSLGLVGFPSNAEAALARARYAELAA